MLFCLLVLATPSIGPPPKVCPLKPEPELEAEDDEPGDDDPGEFEFSPVSDELPEDASPESGLLEPEAPTAVACVPVATACCSAPSRAPVLPPGPPGCAPPSPPAPGCPFNPGICPNSGPLFKVMSC